MFIKLVMASNHLILCCPVLLQSIFPRIRVFSNEPALCIKWPKNQSFSFSISLSNEYSGLISFWVDWLDILTSKGLSRVFTNTTVQKHQFFGAQLSFSTIYTQFIISHRKGHHFQVLHFQVLHAFGCLGILFHSFIHLFSC